MTDSGACLADYARAYFLCVQKLSRKIENEFRIKYQITKHKKYKNNV